MLTTEQAKGVIEFLGASLQESMVVNVYLGNQLPNANKENIEKEYKKASHDMQVFIHNALHVNSVQPDCPGALPPEEDGDVKVGEPA